MIDLVKEPAPVSSGQSWAPDALVDTLACIGWSQRSTASAGRWSENWRQAPAEIRAGELALRAHALDFDDTQLSTTVHPSTVIWPTLWAIADPHVGVGDLYAAWSAGIDLLCGISNFVVPHHLRAGWHATGTIGPLGAVISATHLLGFDTDERLSALAGVCSLVGGLRANNPTPLKAIHAGRGASAAVIALRHRDMGLDHAAAVLDAFASGVSLEAAEPGGPPARRCVDVVAKHYPTCSGTHAALQAANALDVVDPLHGDVIVEVPRLIRDETHNRWPASLHEARLGLPFTIAVMFTQHRVDETALQQGLVDESCYRCFERIRVVVPEEWESNEYQLAARLHVDGQSQVVDESDPFRHPTSEDIDEKFSASQAFAVAPSDVRAADELTPITALLSGLT